MIFYCSVLIVMGDPVAADDNRTCLEAYKHAAVHPNELQCRARLLPPMLGSMFSLLQLTGHTVQFV